MKSIWEMSIDEIETYLNKDVKDQSKKADFSLDYNLEPIISFLRAYQEKYEAYQEEEKKLDYNILQLTNTISVSTNRQNMRYALGYLAKKIKEKTPHNELEYIINKFIDKLAD